MCFRPINFQNLLHEHLMFLISSGSREDQICRRISSGKSTRDICRQRYYLGYLKLIITFVSKLNKMPKLYFRYGPMNSSKTANLLMVAHNYRAQGKKVVLMKPALDTRFGQTMIVSRAITTGGIADILVEPEWSNFSIDNDVYCVLVDEAQFLTEKNVEGLRKLAETVPVICYGLRTDYRSYLFPGSKRLMELADSIEEIKTICVECNRKATMNAKFYVQNGGKVIVRDGSSEPDLGAEEKYQPMCWLCYSAN